MRRWPSSPTGPRGLDIIRHSTAHLLAYAVKELFPDAQVTIGPVIENGFYYDFAYKRPFTPEDLAAHREAQDGRTGEADEAGDARGAGRATRRWRSSRASARSTRPRSSPAIPADEEISLYREGEFVDLCRGPHVPSTGKLKVFKLMKVAGAYWRGDPNNEMLQRIYGTAWAKKEEQEAYLHMLEEAEKRDHRKLGKRTGPVPHAGRGAGHGVLAPQGLGHLAAGGAVHAPRLPDNGYQEVKAPQILDRSLWEKTGHWDNYRENMFTTESEKRHYAIKPMNCPGHMQIYKSGLRSYRDLPLRYGEFGQCHRNEPSGALHGIMRVRGFTQDDGHIFCTEEQILPECAAYTALLQQVYRDFGFTDMSYKVATRPDNASAPTSPGTGPGAPGESRCAGPAAISRCAGRGRFLRPEDRISPEGFDRALLAMRHHAGRFRDARAPGRRIRCRGQSRRKVPVMLHRAIVGSMERFIGILIEHYCRGDAALAGAGACRGERFRTSPAAMPITVLQVA